MVGELHGKVALVTGAGTGIGRETALALAEAGANVIVHYRKSKEDADIVVKLIKDLGRQAHPLQADFADREAVAALAETADEHWGRVDVLVNNAAFVESAVDRGTGAIVNVASIAGLYALTDAPLYSLTKAALLHFTRQAARQYAPKVRINAVAPGWTSTGFGGGFIQDPEFQRQVAKATPLQRVAEPKEIANAIVWLIKEPTFMTGSTLTLDGGIVSELR